MILNKIGNIIKANSSFAITSHVAPDGDNLGSALGLYCALIKAGKKADILIDDTIPERYSFLPNFEVINQNKDLNKKYDAVFALDCADEGRLGNLSELFLSAEININVDHHISNTLYGKHNYVDANASSTGEIIYQLLRIEGFEIDKEIAACLYTSLLTDTGGFKFSNTTSVTLSTAGDLINTGINFSDIYNRVYDVKKITEIKLLGAVASTVETYFDGKAASIYMTADMVKSCGASDDEASDFVNYARDIDTAEVGFFVKEKSENLCRVSLRSKNYVDVRLIAEKFGGGGHKRAAGCTINENVQKAKEMLLAEIEKVI